MFRNAWLCSAFYCLSLFSTPPDFGPWGMSFFKYFGPFVSPMSMLVEGRGSTKAAFTVFATGMEMGAPVDAVNGLTILRDKHGFPIHGIWIETQHIRYSPSEIRELIALGNAAGFHTMVRVPIGDRRDLQGYLDTGVGGIIVPVTETIEQVEEAINHTYYGAWREAGFSPDLLNLQDLSQPHLASIDRNKILAFMVESVQAVDRIDQLLGRAAKLCDKYKIDRRHIVFWMGPYDLKLNRYRIQGFVGDETALSKYAEESIAVVAAAVKKNGFTMGGHMPTLQVGRTRIEKNDFRIFTIPGAADSAYNPTVPSTGGLFGNATDTERAFFTQKPRFEPAERTLLGQVLGCMGDLLTGSD